MCLVRYYFPISSAISLLGGRLPRAIGPACVYLRTLCLLSCIPQGLPSHLEWGPQLPSPHVPAEKAGLSTAWEAQASRQHGQLSLENSSSPTKKKKTKKQIMNGRDPGLGFGKHRWKQVPYEKV